MATGLDETCVVCVCSPRSGPPLDSSQCWLTVVSGTSSIKYQTQNVARSRTGGSSFWNLILNVLNERY